MTGHPDRRRRILDALIERFDRPVITNHLRGIYVECLVADLLKDSGREVSPLLGDWWRWDIKFEGAKIEIKQSAARQTWHNDDRRTKAPRFDIKGTLPNNGRHADIYVFAWHDGDDQRCSDQWEFFVVPSSGLPRHQKTIGLSVLRRLAPTVKASGLAEALIESVEELDRGRNGL